MKKKKELSPQQIAQIKKLMVLFSLLFTIFIEFLSMSIVVTIFSPMLLDVKHSILPLMTPTATRTIMLGCLIASFPLAQFITGPFLGALSDQVGRKKILLFTLFIGILGNTLSAIAIMYSHLPLLFISRLITGASSANLALAQAAIIDLSTEKTKTKNMSYIAFIGGVSWIIGPLLGAKLADPRLLSWFNFATPMWFIVILLIVNLLWIAKGFKESNLMSSREKHGFKQEIKNMKKLFAVKRLRDGFIVFSLFMTGWFFFLLFFPTFLIQKFQFHLSEIGNISAYMSVFWIIGSLLITKILGKRYKLANIIFWPIFLSAIGVYASILVPSSIYLLLTFAIAEIGASIAWVHIVTLVSNLANKNDQGKVFGINQSIRSLALIIAPLISGFIVIGHIALPLTIGSIIIIISAFYYKLVLKNRLKLN